MSDKKVRTRIFKVKCPCCETIIRIYAGVPDGVKIQKRGVGYHHSDQPPKPEEHRRP